jgi:hypothetical protein
MEMQQLLISKATEAISALWFNQLEIIHKSTGIEMQVLINCLNMQVNVEPAREPEKKKRAPAKKKEASPAETKTSTKTSEEEETDSDPNTNAALPEKKKRAPAKKKETPPAETKTSEENPDSALPEKKKRAPAKKKEAPADGEKEEAPLTDDKAKKEAEALEKKAKKEAEALEKKAKKEQSEKEALEKKAKKEAEALEKKAKKEAEALEKKAKKEQSEKEALEKKANEEAKEEKGEDEKKKKAAPKAEDKKKKGKQVVAAVAAAPLLMPKFGANEQVRYVRPNGKTVDVIIEYAIQQEDYVEYRLQVVGKNETILSREESLFELEEKVADPDSSDDDADTVKMADSPQSSPSKPGEEVDINGTLYVIDENKVAYLKSSNKMAGKYDRVRHTICQMQPEEDIYSEHSDEDELPVSDLSDSESGYESN